MIVGNSFANVNEMMKNQISENRNRQVKFSLVKDEGKNKDNEDEEGNSNSLSMKEK